MTDFATAYRRSPAPMVAAGRTKRPGNGATQAGGLLSERERDVLRLLGLGLTNKQVALRLRVAPETVKSHLKHIFRKLAVERRAHAVAKAYDLGLIDPPSS